METLTNDVIRERLHLTIQFLKSLTPPEFRYDDFVYKFNESDNCGTTCCVAGWYPQLYPESGFTWDTNFMAHMGLYFNGSGKGKVISKGLQEFHGLRESIIQALFFGEMISVIHISNEPLGTESGIDSSLDQVIEFWEKIYQYSLDDTLIEYLKL